MQALEDLIGQPQARGFLEASLANEGLAQTLVFVGPNGVGKKTAALAVANRLHKSNQINHPDTFIFSVRLADLVLQKNDSPVKTTVDELIRFLSLSPFSSDYKVAIVDAAEELTDVAQNALLKTLEEPRANVALIVIAENEQQLLPTILSRAQIVRFNPLGGDDIKKIVPDATDEVMKMAMGSAGITKELLADSKLFDRSRTFQKFWEMADRADTEEKFGLVETIKDREEAVWFLKVGIFAWHERFLSSPTQQNAKRLEQLQTTMNRVNGNVNHRLGLEALLLVF